MTLLKRCQNLSKLIFFLGGGIQHDFRENKKKVSTRSSRKQKKMGFHTLIVKRKIRIVYPYQEVSMNRKTPFLKYIIAGN